MYGPCAGSAPPCGISKSFRGLYSAISVRLSTPPSAAWPTLSIKALKGFRGASVLEIVAAFETDTYRSVYTVQFGSAIYVLHAFKKKAKKGRKTPKKEMDLIKTRLEAARRNHKQEAELMAKKTDDTNVTESSGNVFADLGFPNADREQLKAKLRLEIYRAIKDRSLTQTQAGEILGIQQPHVSALMNGAGRQLFSRTAIRVSERAWPRRRDCGASQSAEIPGRPHERGTTVAIR